MTLLDDHPLAGPTTSIDVEVLFKEARRRRRRRWAFGSCLVLVGTLAVLLGLALSGMGSSQFTQSFGGSPQKVPVRQISDGSRVNVDVLTAQAQTTVRVAGTKVVRGSAVPAAPGVGPPIALPRRGYIIGITAGQYQSISDDLQTILHTWSSSGGQYPAPASDPADVWFSDPYAQPNWARKFDGYGHPVAPAVPIPDGFIVLGQIGSALVLQGPPPTRVLDLWDPGNDRMVATLGPFDQEASTSATVAWTSGNVLRFSTARGLLSRRVLGPAADWATSLSFSPNGDQIAVVWSPRPGSLDAVTKSAVAANSLLGVVTANSGAAKILSGSRGAVGPVAWDPDGTHLFYGQMVRSGTSVRLATYALADDRSTILDLSQDQLPSDFSASTGAVIAWRTR